MALVMISFGDKAWVMALREGGVSGERGFSLDSATPAFRQGNRLKIVMIDVHPGGRPFPGLATRCAMTGSVISANAM